MVRGTAKMRDPSLILAQLVEKRGFRIFEKRWFGF
jgi:hypothetical protein